LYNSCFCFCSGWIAASFLVFCLRLVLFWFLLTLLPGASAHNPGTPFPNITFRPFAAITELHFDDNVSLAVVLAFLFTVLRNPSLLTLHYRRKQKLVASDMVQPASNWGLFLADRMLEAWSSAQQPLLRPSNVPHQAATLTAIEDLAVGLRIAPSAAELSVSANPAFLDTIDESPIQHLLVLTAPRPHCITAACQKRSLTRGSKDSDVPTVTVISGTQIITPAWVLAGKCSL